MSHPVAYPHLLCVGMACPQVEQQRSFGPDCTLRTLALTCSSTGATHTLSHYHFHAWPDHGMPDSSNGIRAICRALAPARETGRPIVVHCSAVSEWRNGALIHSGGVICGDGFTSEHV